MIEFQLPKTFAKNQFTFNPDATPFKHFIPENLGHDKFGNRMFASPNFSYLDRENQPTKAGILISRLGDEFIKANPKILIDLDRAFEKLENTELPSEARKKGVGVGSKGTLKLLTVGGQSNVYLLEIGSQKYISKTKRPSSKKEEFLSNVNQPYINEMLQTQNLEFDLREELKQFNINLPDYLFASGQVSLVKFEEGKECYLPSIYDVIRGLEQVVRNYILKQRKSNNKLWNGIVVDSRFDNFLEKGDGKIIWIDPFRYYPSIKKI
ncbi:MAG: hypothetical protein WC744_01320 [Patescibacteria group bacterium]